MHPVIRKALSIFAAFLYSGSAGAIDLEDEALFHRCYSHLTGMRAPLNHASLSKIKQGTSSALVECNKILDSTALDASSGLLKVSNSDTLRILNNFNRVHGAWFGVQGYTLNASVNRYTHDYGEAGLYVSKFLFGDESYKGLLTESRVPMALRSNTTAETTHFSVARKISVTRNAAGDVTDERDLAPVVSSAAQSTLIQRGVLQGIRWRSGAHVLTYSNLSDPNHLDAQKTAFAALKAKTSDHFGSGILGLPSYFMANHATPSVANGAGVHMRRWARNLASDLLCRDLPLIRLSDVKPVTHIDTSNAQKIAYRRDATCMRCHASIDPMGATARNLQIKATANLMGQFTNLYHVEKTTPTKGNLNIFSITTEAGSADFPVSNPTGSLYMRSYDGTLINKPLNGFSALSAELLNTKDYYACAARRYFEHFTGIRVSLQDINDPNESGLTEDDLHYRSMVVELGNQFMQDNPLTG